MLMLYPFCCILIGKRFFFLGFRVITSPSYLNLVQIFISALIVARI